MERLLSDVTVYYTSSPEERVPSRALLLQAAQRHSGLTGTQLGPVETNPWGKPFFSKHPELHFSVTHSGNWWMCAFSVQPVGLDRQHHHTYLTPETLSQRFFHPLEHAFLLQENHRSFYDLWCAKESLVKYTGHGFFDCPETFSVVSPSGAFPCSGELQFRLLPFAPDYSLCLCAQYLGEIRLTTL